MFETQTLGLNPQVLTSNIIKERVINNFELYQSRKNITHLYFYGAGCGTEPPRILIKKVFESIFSNASITIKEDTYAAVYACSDIGEKSIVSIIGTGSNCSYFDGEKIIQKVTSLGYILMDDASGNYFGRQLIRDYFFEKMPSYIPIPTILLNIVWVPLVAVPIAATAPLGLFNEPALKNSSLKEV